MFNLEKRNRLLTRILYILYI